MSVREVILCNANALCQSMLIDRSTIPILLVHVDVG